MSTKTPNYNLTKPAVTDFITPGDYNDDMDIIDSALKANAAAAAGAVSVVQASSKSAFPATGSADKIYIAADTRNIYRWTGTLYEQLAVVTTDAAPVSGSKNPLESGGAYTELEKKAAKATTLAGYGITDAYTEAQTDNAISAHNTATGAHGDIRTLISGLTTRLNTLANSDDTTLDQMAEIVSYIKSNRTLIESVTTDKVSVSAIIDNLTTNVSTQPLSAAQGVALKTLIDSLTSIVNGKQATLTFDSTPTSGSTNPVTSGGVYTGLSGKAASSHSHVESEITGLSADLALKGNTQTYIITDSTTLTIPTTAWVTNTNSQAETAEKTDYPYMAILTIPSSLTGGKAVTADDTGESFPNYADSISENFFKHAYTTAGGLIIEAVTKPTAAMTLLQVKIERRLS